MCHLVLLMPVFGIAVFWFLPLSLAVPVYLSILLSSGYIYFKLMRAMSRPVQTGNENLLNKTAKVIAKHGRTGQVGVNGEIWEAEFSENLKKGDLVRITKIEGLMLHVRKMQNQKKNVVVHQENE